MRPAYIAVSAPPAPDTTPPQLTLGPRVEAKSDTLAAIVWRTDEPATSAVDYGTISTTLTQTITSTGLVLDHRLILRPLAPDTTYYFQVRAADAMSNTTTSSVQTFRTSATLLFALNLMAGWNLVSLPFSPTVPYRASDLAADLARDGLTVRHVAQWKDGAWQSYVPEFPTNDFTLDFGRGYFVRTSGPGRWRPGMGLPN